MAVQNFTATSSWVKIVALTRCVISIKTSGNKNLLINSVADDTTAENILPGETDTLIVQDEAKDVQIRSDSTTDWIVTVRTEG